MKDVVLSPELVASIAVLITAITGLILALRGQAAQAVTAKVVNETRAQVSAHGATIDKVLTQTNGMASQSEAHIVSLEHLLGDMHTLVMGMMPPTPPPVTPPSPAPPAPAVP
jgi:hypothetical protein